MTDRNNQIHTEIMDKISQILRKNNFSIGGMSSQAWEPMKNVTIVPDKQKIQNVIDNRWYFGSESKNKTFVIDVLGCLQEDSKFNYDKIIAVEVSVSSDIKKEIEKLKLIPTKWKVVVTERINGELERIPVIAIPRFEDFVQSVLSARSD